MASALPVFGQGFEINSFSVGNGLVQVGFPGRSYSYYFRHSTPSLSVSPTPTAALLGADATLIFQVATGQTNAMFFQIEQLPLTSTTSTAIGQIAPQSAGYPNASNDLAGLGYSARIAGNGYRYTSVGPNPLGVPAVAWNIVFPGGFDPANGSNYLSNASSTYIATDIAQEDYDLRARLEVNPGDTDAPTNLVITVYDQMLPLEWSGTMAMASSAYARLLGLTQNGTNVETLVVEEARHYFLGACNVLPQFLANPFNAVLVEGQNPLLSDAAAYTYDPTELYEVRLETTGHLANQTNNPRQKDERRWMMNSVRVTVADKEMAERTAQAFRHAVQLARSKESF
jgi:hypothetical protein